jgi:hypothetical protein
VFVVSSFMLTPWNRNPETPVFPKRKGFVNGFYIRARDGETARSTGGLVVRVCAVMTNRGFQESQEIRKTACLQFCPR